MQSGSVVLWSPTRTTRDFDVLSPWSVLRATSFTATRDTWLGLCLHRAKILPAHRQTSFPTCGKLKNMPSCHLIWNGTWACERNAEVHGHSVNERNVPSLTILVVSSFLVCMKISPRTVSSLYPINQSNRENTPPPHTIPYRTMQHPTPHHNAMQFAALTARHRNTLTRTDAHSTHTHTHSL